MKTEPTLADLHRTSDVTDLDLLVDFEQGASVLDHISLFQGLEKLLGVEVNVVACNALKSHDDHIRAEAIDL
jgi:uncharacterized protein